MSNRSGFDTLAHLLPTAITVDVAGRVVGDGGGLARRRGIGRWCGISVHPDFMGNYGHTPEMSVHGRTRRPETVVGDGS